MPEQKTSGQPMDTYAGGPGYAGPMGGNNPPASAKDEVPLTGSKGPEGIPLLGSANDNSIDTGKHKGAAPMFMASDSMQDTSGPH
jgi:hypothetical protein